MGIASQMPPQEDDAGRKQRDLERQVREQASAKSGQAMQIGSGGLLINGGGSLTIEGTGQFNTNGAITTAGAFTAGTTITAGSTISTPGNVQGGGVVSTGALSVAAGGAFGGEVSGATCTFPGGVNSVGVYNNLLSVAYRVQYVDSTGAMGYVPSSRRFKRDIATAPSVVEALMAIRVVTFRYNAAVAELGDSAAIEWGVIAEEMDALGLTWAVDYDAEGLPFGVKYDRLMLAMIPTIQDHETTIRDHENRLTAAGF